MRQVQAKIIRCKIEFILYEGLSTGVCSDSKSRKK